MPSLRMTALRRIQENLSRWREIAGILVKYGFQDLLDPLGLGSLGHWLQGQVPGAEVARLPREVRLRLALTELGTTGIKLGQILSTRADLVGAELATELERLQADGPADPPEAVQARVEAELGQPLETVFRDFEDHPLASASIAQVHAARLAGGERVVLKLRHRGVSDRVRVDLAILGDLVALAERVPDFATYRPRRVYREFRRTLLRELDLSLELAHMRRIAEIFRAQPQIRVPKAYPQFCSRRLLTMERLEGVRVNDLTALRASGLDLDTLARRGAEMYMEMILGHGFYHADPHPGNLLVLPDGAIGLLDYGMVGRLDEQSRDDIEALMLAVIDQDAAAMADVVLRLSRAPADLDRSELAWDLDELVAGYLHQPVEHFDMSGALSALLELVRGYRLVLPGEIALLIKVLVMLEGTGRQLSPSFSLIEAMRPYRRRLLARRASPPRQLRRLLRFGQDLDRLLGQLPASLNEALERMRSGRFYMRMDHRGLEPSVNRLALGLLASSLFLGSALLLAFDVPPLWRDLSLPGAAGMLLSARLSWRLLRAIDRSGHLDGR